MEFVSPDVKPSRKMLFTQVLKTTPPVRAENQPVMSNFVVPKLLKGKKAVKRKIPVLCLNLNEICDNYKPVHASTDLTVSSGKTHGKISTTTQSTKRSTLVHSKPKPVMKTKYIYTETLEQKKLTH